MSTETELRDLIERALDDVTMPSGLGDQAVTAGERLRRRRRAGTALAGLAAAAAVAAIALPLGGGGTATTGTPAGGSSPSPSAPVSAEPTPGPLVSHPGWWDMPVAQMRDRLADLLPEDVTIADFERTNTDHAPGESDRFRGYLRGTLAAADGSLGSVNIMLVQLPQDADALASELHRMFACDRAEWEADGPMASFACTGDSAQQRTVELADQGVTYREARRRAGNGSIYVAVANSVEAKWGPPASADQPPLTLDDLERIAASDVWTDWSPRRR